MCTRAFKIPHLNASFGRRMRRAWALLVVVWMTLGGARTWGAEVPVPPGRFAFRAYGKAEGLTSNSVRKLLQDREGFLWVLTEDGCFRFDGQRFEALGAAQGLQAKGVRSMLLDGQGRPWVGSPAGLHRWVGRTFQRVPLRGGGSSEPEILAMDQGDRGAIWAASASELWRIPVEGPPESLAPPPEVRLTTLAADPAGRLWVGELCSDRPARLWCREQGRWQPLELPGALRESVEALVVDGQGGLWARSPRGCWHLPRGAAAFQTLKGLPPKVLQHPTLFLDEVGAPMVPTDEGLFVLRDGTFQRIGIPEGLPDPRVAAALVDREGSLWLGGVGLWRQMGRGLWMAYTAKEGLPEGGIPCLARDLQGRLWVGCDRGAVMATPTGWRGVPGLEGHAIRSIVPHPDGSMLLAGRPLGVFRLRPSGVLEHYGAEAGLKGLKVTRLLLDPEGLLWVATDGGGLRWADTAAPRLRFQESVLAGEAPGGRVVNLWAGAEGRLYATDDGGIRIREGKTWRRLGKDQGLQEGAVFAALEVHPGELWVAYRVRPGLWRYRLQGERVVPWPWPEGEARRAGKNVLLAGEDARDRLWIGTGEGLVTYPAQGAPMPHDARDGLVEEDTNNMAFLADPNGDVWIGTATGLARYLGSRERPQPGPPSVAFRKLTLAGIPLLPGQELRLPRTRRTLEASYAALSYYKEGSLEYQVRLEGAETEWSGTTTTEARYAALRPGDHALQVRARVIGTSEWGPPASLAFRLLPLWWETLSFRVLASLGVLAGVAGLAVWRMRALKRHNEVLEGIVEARTHELRLAKDAAERASAFKSTFVATTSHELRTPLTAILGFIRLLSSVGVRELDRRQYLATMGGAADALLQLVNDLLDLSRIEAGALTLDPSPFSPRELLEEVAGLLGTKIHEKGLLLLVEVAPEVPGQVLGDSKRLRQMLVNLLGNAQKFTERGHIRLQASLSDRDGDHVLVRFAVADTGQGVPPEVLPQLFQAYTQAESAAKHQGTGLGLSITRHLAELMGGTAGAESVLGQGSTFWVEARLQRLGEGVEDRPLAGRRLAIRVDGAVLAEHVATCVRHLGGDVSEEAPDLWVVRPREAAPPEADPILLVLDPGAPAPPEAVRVLRLPFGERAFQRACLGEAEPLGEVEAELQGRGGLEGRVLVADDNEGNRILMEAMLRQLGVEQHLVRDGDEAVEAFRAQPFDLVLMDRNMVRMDGITAMKAIRELPGGMAVPILLFSASVTEEAIQEALRAGFDDYLKKPVEAADFRRAVIRRLRGRTQEIPAAEPKPEAGLEAWDPAYLERLEPLLGGAEALADFVAGTLEASDGHLQALVRALKVLDRHLVERHAHDFKSNVGNLGMVSLANLAEQVEHQAAQASPEHLELWLRPIREAYGPARDGIRGWLKTRGA